MHLRLQPLSCSSSRASPTAPRLPSLADVQASAKCRGLSITLSTLGPFYRVVCSRPLTSQPSDADSNSPSKLSSSSSTTSSSAPPIASLSPSLRSRHGDVKDRDREVLGVSEGFLIPWLGLMHCDTLQIFTRGLKGEEGERLRGGVLGLGLLLGGAVFAYGLQQGCRKAEILAINDDDSWHERLVRYYSYFGFKKVRKVGGNGLSDLPHLLVWGGEGERMDADIERTLKRWTPAILSPQSSSGKV